MFVKRVWHRKKTVDIIFEVSQKCTLILLFGIIPIFYAVEQV